MAAKIQVIVVVAAAVVSSSCSTSSNGSGGDSGNRKKFSFAQPWVELFSDSGLYQSPGSF